MINPLRSEAEAFRFLIASIVYFGAIVIAALIDKWAGVAVFVLLSAAVLAWWFRTRREERPAQTAPRPHAEGERRILVVANETVGGPELLAEVRARSQGVAEKVLVVCPALNSPLRHWVSDEDEARRAAQARLQASLESMHAVGIDARGEIGDGDPLQAIEDAVRTFAPDELIVSTHPEGRSHWLERGVVDRARERFDLPVLHVVVDLDADRT